MAKAVVIGIVLLSFLSVPVLFGLSKAKLMKNESVVLGASVASIAAVVGGAALLFHCYFKKVDPAMYAFSVFSFCGVTSLILALELDGYAPSLLLPYIKKIEPYHVSAHGTMNFYWDGTVQVLLCFAAIALYVHRESHREVSLYWAGSVLNAMLVIVPAAVTGPHTVGGGMIVNLMVYTAVPFLIAIRYLHRSPIQARSFIKFPAIWRRPVDFLFIVFFKLAALVAIFRLLTVLGGNASCMKDYLKAYEPYLKDANMFPKMQTMSYGYFFLAYYVMAIYGLLFPGQHWMADWSLIMAGASAHAQFSYVTGALHHRTPKGLHPPTSGQAAHMFWAVNILLFAIPQLFAIWCNRDPEKYGRTFTLDLAQPLKTYVVTKVNTSSSPRKSSRKLD